MCSKPCQIKKEPDAGTALAQGSKDARPVAKRERIKWEGRVKQELPAPRQSASAVAKGILAPSRKRSAWMMYRETRCLDRRRNEESLGAREIWLMAREEWRRMSPEEKAPYEAGAAWDAIQKRIRSKHVALRETGGGIARFFTESERSNSLPSAVFRQTRGGIRRYWRPGNVKSEDDLKQEQEVKEEPVPKTEAETSPDAKRLHISREHFTSMRGDGGMALAVDHTMPCQSPGAWCPTESGQDGPWAVKEEPVNDGLCPATLDAALADAAMDCASNSSLHGEGSEEDQELFEESPPDTPPYSATGRGGNETSNALGAEARATAEATAHVNEEVNDCSAHCSEADLMENTDESFCAGEARCSSSGQPFVGFPGNTGSGPVQHTMLTDEQQSRIAANRAAALERRRVRESQTQPSQPRSPSCAPLEQPALVEKPVRELTAESPVASPLRSRHAAALDAYSPELGPTQMWGTDSPSPSPALQQDAETFLASPLSPAREVEAFSLRQPPATAPARAVDISPTQPVVHSVSPAHPIRRCIRMSTV